MRTRLLRTVALPFAGLALALSAVDASAQRSVAAEARVGITVPVGDLSDQGADVGVGVGAEAMLNLRPNLTAYVGGNHHGFGCDDPCAMGESPSSTGIAGGLKYILPSPPDALIWSRAGVVGHQIRTSDGSSDFNPGFELGAGIDMPVTDRLDLVPHVGFVYHGADGPFTSNYLTFGVGGHYHLR